MIHLRHEIYSFPHNADTQALPNQPTCALQTKASPFKGGFTFECQLNFADIAKEGHLQLVENKGVFQLYERQAISSDENSDYLLYMCDLQEFKAFDIAQHYSAHPMPDGSVKVIEAMVLLSDAAHPKWRHLCVGFPLSLYSLGVHTVALHTDGVRLLLLVDGKIADENFIYGDFQNGDIADEMTLNTKFVKDAFFSAPAIKPEVKVQYEDSDESVQYFSTSGFDSWVGDVVPYTHDGVAHIFYLFDRRHHGSKFGTGTHFYGHLTSTDLLDWTEQEFIGIPQFQWETCGTGTPFFHNGKYYFAYGLHTNRFLPYEENGGQVMHDDAGEGWKNPVHPRSFEALAPKRPEGMTYAWSEDGIHFHKSFMLTHFCENPSVYTMPDNTLKMYAEGIWTADSVDSDWHCVSTGFPPSGKASALRNTLECPSFFEWNNHYYLVVGMSGFYSSATSDFKEYRDLAAEGLDVYDGLIVPMVFPWHNNRRLIAGWIFPFGSYLVIRELVALDNHELGIKWIPELVPAAKDVRTIAENISADSVLDCPFTQGKSFCINAEIDGSKGGKFAVRFHTDNGGCEFQIDTDGAWAQFETFAESDGFFKAPLKTMRENVFEWADRVESFKEMPSAIKYKCHVFTRDFRLDKMRGVNGKFIVRLMVKQDPKWPCLLLDAEIAGMRTMVSLRPNAALRNVDVKTTLDVAKLDVLEY